MENQQIGNVKGTLFTMEKAKTSKVAGGKRYIPLSALEALGRIFLEGVTKYGEWNWKNGVGDKPYQMERWEHASRHLQLWAEGDRSEEHLAKVMWFCATQIELERIEREGERVGVVDLDELFSSTVRQVDYKEPTVAYTPRDSDAIAKAYKRQESPVGWPDSVEREGVVDTLKDVGREVGTAALLTGIEKLIALLTRRNAVYTPPPVDVVEVKKEKEPRKKRVMSEEGKARIAAAQRKRWAKVRREKKAQEKGKSG